MRFPWQRRADEAEKRRREAEERFDRAQADWDRVQPVVSEMQHQKNANGWTGILAELFASQRGR